MPPNAAEDSEDGADEEEEDTASDDGTGNNEAAELQLKLLDAIKDDTARQNFLQRLAAASPNHLATLVAVLDALKPDKAEVSDIIEAADAVLAQIDEDELAIYLGKVPKPACEQGSNDQRVSKVMAEKRKAWTTAYARKIEASLNLGKSHEVLQKLFVKYRQFVDDSETDNEHSLIAAKVAFAHEVRFRPFCGVRS